MSTEASMSAPKVSSKPRVTKNAPGNVLTDVVQLECSPKASVRKIVRSKVASEQNKTQETVKTEPGIGNDPTQSISATHADGEACTSGANATNQTMENEPTSPGQTIKSEVRTQVQNPHYMTYLDAKKLRQEVEAMEKSRENAPKSNDSAKSSCLNKESRKTSDQCKIKSANTTSTNIATMKPLTMLSADQEQIEPSKRAEDLESTVTSSKCEQKVNVQPQNINPSPSTFLPANTDDVVSAGSPKQSNLSGTLHANLRVEDTKSESVLVDSAVKTNETRDPVSSQRNENENENHMPSNYGIDYLRAQAKSGTIPPDDRLNSAAQIIQRALATRNQSLDISADVLNNRDIIQQLLIATEQRTKEEQTGSNATENNETQRSESGRSSCLPTSFGRPPSVDPDNAITAAVASQAPKELASERIYRVMHACRFNGADDLEVKAEEIVKGLPDPNNPHQGKKTLVASICRPGRRGYVPNFFLRKITQIDFEPWYLGKITRQYSERLLLESDLPVRSFLVRHSGLGYIISVKSLNDDGRLIVKHKTIADNTGRFSMFNSEFFDTIPELVSFHTTRRGGYYLSHPFQKPKLGLSPGILAPIPDIPEPRRSGSTTETSSISAFKWWSLGFFRKKSLRKIRPTGASNDYNQFP